MLLLLGWKQLGGRSRSKAKGYSITLPLPSPFSLTFLPLPSPLPSCTQDLGPSLQGPLSHGLRPPKLHNPLQDRLPSRPRRQRKPLQWRQVRTPANPAETPQRLPKTLSTTGRPALLIISSRSLHPSLISFSSLLPPLFPRPAATAAYTSGCPTASRRAQAYRTSPPSCPSASTRGRCPTTRQSVTR